MIFYYLVTAGSAAAYLLPLRGGELRPDGHEEGQARLRAAHDRGRHSGKNLIFMLRCFLSTYVCNGMTSKLLLFFYICSTVQFIICRTLSNQSGKISV
jgi:hypothetical protein